MTDCNTKPLLFASLASKSVQADFHGGSLSTDAGALLLREADLRLGLLDALDHALVDPREPSRIEHSQRSLLAQRVLGIALGYEDLNDHDGLRHDPLWHVLAERAPDPEQPLGSAPTLCRLENRVQRADLIRLSAVLVETFIASHVTPPECLILDFDATDDPVHGNQEGRFFHGYYGGYCFLPLYVFCGDQPLVAYPRTSKIDAAKHSRAILKLLVTRLRQTWPEVKIIVRADSGFCRWQFMRWCDHNGVGYVLGLARNPRLEALALDWTATAQRRHQQTGEPQRLFGSLGYAAATWDRPRRVLAKAEHDELGANPRFVVSNLPGEPQASYDEVYCARGEMENRIKEQQLMLFADRTSCQQFLANQFRLLLSAAAYVLVEAVRRLGLRGTELERAQVGTIRLRLLKLAAVVKVSVRRIVLHLASGYPLRDLFAVILARLRGEEPVAASATG